MVAVVASCGGAQRDAVSTGRVLPSGPDPLAYLPAHPEVVYSVNVDAFRASSLWANFARRFVARGSSAKLAVLAEHCHLDVVATLHVIRGAITKWDEISTSSTVIADGMDGATAKACIAQIPQFHLDGQRARFGPSGVATIDFVEPRTFVFITGSRAQRTLDRSAPLRHDPGFLEMFDNIDRNATAWAIVDGRIGVLAATRARGVDVRWVAFSITPGADHVAFSVRIRFGEPAHAQTLAKELEFKHPFEKLEVVASGTDLFVNAAMTDKQFFKVVFALGKATGWLPDTPASGSAPGNLGDGDRDGG